MNCFVAVFLSFFGLLVGNMSSIGSLARSKGLFSHTPLIFKDFDDVEVFFKIDALQPSGSFKDRGIGHMIVSLASKDTVKLLVSSSGGNAGHAVATAGQKLGIPVHVYVPVTTNPLMIEKIKQKGASVFIGGENWNAADALAREALSSEPGARYIPPFDDPLLWEGHSSLVHELVADLGQESPPDDIILSVGGGGLLVGVQEGLSRVGWHNTVIQAVETDGAASFAAAKAAGTVTKLEKISSIASSLGALAVTPATLASSVRTDSVVVSDRDAVHACVDFLNDQRILVEPACGAALSLVYSPTLRQRYLPSSLKKRRVVVIVCGGSAVSLDLLSGWMSTFP